MAWAWLVGADYGGKFGITALFVTTKWNLGGKRSGRGRFATRKGLEKPEADWR